MFLMPIKILNVNFKQSTYDKALENQSLLYFQQKSSDKTAFCK